MTKLDGVTVVICCYNSAKRLPKTLNHLLDQEVDAAIPWEIIIIDNHSSDATAQVAEKIRAASASVPMRIIEEPRQGLMFARERGFLEATYELVSFVDDDNWVAKNWIQKVFDIMSTHPRVGACGGKVAPSFESEPPFWFDLFQSRYAVGDQANVGGRLTAPQSVLWGAGLTLRKSASNILFSHKDYLMLSDRNGEQLTSGGDTEICYRLKLIGWDLWYDPSLFLQHYIPNYRLSWKYLRKMSRGFGASNITIDFYHWANKEYPFQKHAIQRSWIYRIGANLAFLLRHPKAIVHAIVGSGEGDLDVLLVEERIGALNALWCLGFGFEAKKNKIAISIPNK